MFIGGFQPENGPVVAIFKEVLTMCSFLSKSAQLYNHYMKRYGTVVIDITMERS